MNKLERCHIPAQREAIRLYQNPECEPSGIAWLGDVPKHWQARRIKTLFHEVDERNGGIGELLSLTRAHGLIPQVEASNRIASVSDLSNYKVCRTGNLVMNRMQAWSGMFAVPSTTGLVSPDYCVFETIEECEVRYFEHLFKTRLLVGQFARMSKGIGSGFNRLYTPDFGSISVVYPPLDEQTAIVRYLDHADERINRAISAKERLIELLTEQRQATIHSAVTRGLDPNVRLKDSGVEWLGDVPEYWGVRRLKTLCRMKSGDGITVESIEPCGEYPVYGGNGLRGYTSDFTHDGEFVLIGRQGALCGNIHIARNRFWASEHAVVAALDAPYIVEWFAATLEMMNLNQYSISAAQPGLSVDRVLNLSLPVPPLSEQKAIARHIYKASSRADTEIDNAQRQIDLLREYRTRLIADVVTGQVDVRDAVVN